MAITITPAFQANFSTSTPWTPSDSSPPTNGSTSIYFVCVKPGSTTPEPTVAPTSATASDFTSLGMVKSNAGVGPSTDAGDTYIFLFVRNATSNTAASFDITGLTGGGGGGVVWGSYVTFISNGQLYFAVSTGSDDSTASHNVYTAPLSPDPPTRTGDKAFVISTRGTDSFVNNNPVVNQTGLTMSLTETIDSGTTLGTDMKAYFAYTQTNMTGPGTGAATFTFSTSTGTNIYGPSALVLVSETPFVTPFIGWGVPL